MANNAKFEIEIYGNTAQFENSLKGVNSAMKGLKGEASQLKRELRLDPTNTSKMAALQRNLQQQLQASKQKAAELRKEIANVDKSTPKGQAEWTRLQKQLKDNEIQAGYLEKEIEDVGAAIKRGNWNMDLDTSKAEAKVSRFKGALTALKEVGIGALRQIGSTAISALGNGLTSWIDDAKATQKAMNALRNTMDFTGTGKDFDYLSNRMAQVAKDTNANTEDALKLGSTFVGLGDNAQKAGDKVESIIKANQAFGGTGEQLKGVVQAYSQMSAAGKVSAENINQLTDNNTALGAALKKTVMDMNPALKQYGSFAAASEKGAVTVEMLDGALEKLGKAGGGSVETIDDAMASLNETISLALLPILDDLTPAITSFINAIADNVPTIVGYISDTVKWFQNLFNAIGKSNTMNNLVQTWLNLKFTFSAVWGVIKSLLQDFGLLKDRGDNAKESYQVLADVIESLTGVIAKVVEKIAVFINHLTDSKGKIEAIKVVLAALAGAFAAFKIADGVFKAIAIFAKMQKAIRETAAAFKLLGTIAAGNWVVLLIAAITAVVAGLVYFFTKTEKGKKMWADFTQFLSETMANIVKFFQDSWKAITDAASSVVDNIKSFFQGIGEWFSNLWQGIVDTAKTIWGGLTAVFEFYVESYKAIFTGLGEFFSGIWNGIVNIAKTVWGGLTAFFQQWITALSAIFAPIVSVFQSIWNLVVAVINLAWQIIWGLIKTVYNNIVNLWNGIIGIFKGIWNAISGAASTAWNAIVSFASGAWNRVVGVWNKVAAWFGGVWRAVSNAASNAWNAIVNFASNAWNRVVGVWNRVAGWFGGIFSQVSNVVANAFNQVAAWASNGFNRIVGVFGRIGGWFAGVFNSVANIVANVFNQFYGFAANAFNNIVNVFSGIVGFFSNIFNSVANIVNSVLGGITGAINSITSAVNGVAGKIKGFFGGSMVAELREISLAGAGFVGNSATASSTTTSNTFHIQAGAMDITQLARAIKREIDNGRA